MYYMNQKPSNLLRITEKMAGDILEATPSPRKIMAGRKRWKSFAE
jgi:hypothetical protein